MVKIRIISTGEIKEETPNVAFDLIDRGIAEVYKEGFSYPNRQMRANRFGKEGIKTK